MDSECNLIFDITCMGRFIGLLVSEYAQTSSNKVDYHTYPSGNKVIKAFTSNNFVFFDKAGNTLILRDNSWLDQAHKAQREYHLAHPKEPSKWTGHNYLSQEDMLQNMPNLSGMSTVEADENMGH